MQKAPYVHYIAAIWIDGTAGSNLTSTASSHWRVDACMSGPDSDKLRASAYRLASSASTNAGNTLTGCVIRITDSDEADAIQRSKIMTAREAELLGADVILPAIAA